MTKIKKDYLWCFFTVIIVFVFFAHTLNYPWKHFDDQIIYNETLLPAPLSFHQIFEYLFYLGPINYIEASNPFYSTISSIRWTNVPFDLFVFWLLKKSAFAYHTFSFLLHLINSCLCFLIINKTSLLITKLDSKDQGNYRLCLVSLLTLIFALHPVNIESVLFASNFGALITYCFCLSILFYLINLNHQTKTPLYHLVLLFLLYLFPLFLNEYSVTLPFILFFYLTAVSLFYNSTIKYKYAVLQTLKEILPLLLALTAFVINFFSLHIVKTSQETSLTITLERILWLSPQIFLHFLKLILSPIHLTIDQGTLVKLSTSLFEPYAISCILFMLGLIILSLISLFFIRKSAFFFYFIIIFVSFFLSLLPFLHIISPIYNLASERYLYFPLFFLILGFSHLIFFIFYRSKNVAFNVFILVILSIVLFIFSTRAYLRTLDWQDSISLFTSAIKEAKSELIKGLRLQMLGGVLSTHYKDTDSQISGDKFIFDGNTTLEKSFLQLEEEKQKFQNRLPQVIKSYGLDPKTMQAKIAYLLAFNKLGLEGNIKDAYELLKPYMQDLSIIDTQILDLYAGLLFATNNLDEAERLLNYALKNKPSPTVLTILSELYKRKYINLSKTEMFLKESFKYFPYDTRTLESLKSFYLEVNNPNNFAFFSYLHGIRTHSEQSLQDAFKIYTKLYNQKMSKEVMENIKLLKRA